METIVVALITGGLSLLGVIITSNKTTRDVQAKLDTQQAVTDSLGRHHQLSNLSIHDGSLFPTSIGANPQLSIYGLTAKLATLLAERLKA